MGAANALIVFGLAAGPAFGTFAGGHIMDLIGWRWLFVIFGLGSAVWLVPWLWSTRSLSREADRPPEDHGAAPSYLAILARRDLWGVSIAHFCLNYGFYFILTLAPDPIGRGARASVVEMGRSAV